MKKKFFVTTPIYYANWVPHIGHAYSSLVADIIARYKRLNWFDVKFSTGVDENSQKVVEKAKENKQEVMEFLDKMAETHKNIWDWLHISYTDFIRTTEPRHHKFVQKILQKSYENWDIYKWTYEWLYCVGCEAFKMEKELTSDWLCPDHLTKPDKIKEQNYFFKLSKYQAQLEEFYAKNKDFVIPDYRLNEMKNFFKEWLVDFSISRETNKFGIPLPFDSSQVTYVWYDALLNYLTVCQDWDEDFWPADLHIVWKEISRFHILYWPAMLLSAGYELPKNILVTGFLTIDWQKISKSIWNVIDPVEFSGKYSRDLMLLYLITTFPIGQDGDFSEAQAVTIFNAKLANNIGNLLNRFLVLSLKIWGKINWITDEAIEKEKLELIKKYKTSMDKYDLKTSLELIFEFGDTLNKYLDTTKPWELKDDSELEKLTNILYTLWEWLRTIAVLLHPFFYDKMNEVFERIGQDSGQLSEIWMDEFLEKKVGFEVKEKGEGLYGRIM